jgi:hypothetical protein
LARTYCRLRTNGILDDRTIALLGRFYREAHSDDTPEVEWKTSTIRQFLKQQVIAKSIAVVRAHVDWEIRVLRDEIRFRQTGDGFRAHIASARKLLSEGEIRGSIDSQIDRYPGTAAAWLIVAAEMKMDLGGRREKWREFVQRDFAAYHQLREFYQGKQIDPEEVFGLTAAEIDLIIETDVARTREEEAKLVAIRDGSLDPLSQCKVSSP